MSLTPAARSYLDSVLEQIRLELTDVSAVNGRVTKRSVQLACKPYLRVINDVAAKQPPTRRQIAIGHAKPPLIAAGIASGPVSAFLVAYYCKPSSRYSPELASLVVLLSVVTAAVGLPLIREHSSGKTEKRNV